MNELIIYLSPFLAAGMLWFIVSHITDVKNQITEVKGHIFQLKNELTSVEKHIVQIQVNIEYLKDRDKIEKRDYNPEVTVIKKPKTRFE